MKHTPVLLKEVIKNLNIKTGGLYIDATVGEGGHLFEILRRGGKVLGIDWDVNQIKNLKLKIKNDENVILVNGNFAKIEEIAKKNNFFPVNGVIFDLGLSIRQIKESGRGFSYKNLNEPLDMRLSNKIKITAAELINSLNEDELYEILAKYSEEINSRAIAQSIVSTRSLKRVNKVGDLIKVINKVVGRSDKKIYSRVFQALRIATNDEFENLKKGLDGALKILKSDGRIVVVTFHSLEDRLVKQFVKAKELSFLYKKPIFGDKNLPFERSAKLRIIIKH